MSNSTFTKRIMINACLYLLISASIVAAQSAPFTYQGSLKEGGAPANGQYDFTFRLYQTVSGGAQIGSDVVLEDVQVSNGVFTVNLDFSLFPFVDGTGRYLEISVRPGVATGAFTLLAPRRQITNVPYAIRASTLGNVTADRFVRDDGAGRVGIGTTSPNFKLEILDSSNTGLRVQNNTAGGTVASFGGFGKFLIDAPGVAGGRLAVLENGNVGLGNYNPSERLVVEGNTILGGNAAINGNTTINAGNLKVNGGRFDLLGTGNANMFLRAGGAANGINFGVAANAGTNSTLFIAHYDGTTYQDRLIIDSYGNMAIPTGAVDFGYGEAPVNARIRVNGTISTSILSSAGNGVDVCWGQNGEYVWCSSSRRYKYNIESYARGLALVKLLRPVTYNWKSNDKKDIGFIAEEVNEVEPLLIERNQAGEIESVKYKQITAVLVNAVNEQQKQIENQQNQINSQTELIKNQQTQFNQQKTEIEALKQFICSQDKTAKLCQPEN